MLASLNGVSFKVSVQVSIPPRGGEGTSMHTSVDDGQCPEVMGRQNGTSGRHHSIVQDQSVICQRYKVS